MRRICFLIFPDFQLLDVAGPIAAFEIAAGFETGAYALELRAHTPGKVRSSSGVTLEARGLGRGGGIHTLIVAGGNGIRDAARCEVTRRFVRRCASRSKRIASVCSGTYVLAAAGLLDGKPATTHWCRSADFQRHFLEVRLQPDRIFVRAGKLWSSAGISAGIDLALALVGEDLGESVARRVARQLVVYYKRPGGQSQFSSLVELESERFSSLLDHVRTHLSDPLTVPELAAHVGMSPRNFTRVFTADTGVTPAKAVERVRIETAHAALETSSQSLTDIARSCGFGDAERMRRAVTRYYGAPPSALRRRH